MLEVLHILALALCQPRDSALLLPRMEEALKIIIAGGGDVAEVEEVVVEVVEDEEVVNKKRFSDPKRPN